jgi:tRNA(fMet)-specific endonuclease VapC
MSSKQLKVKYLLDTNICIYIQREKPVQVLEKFKTLHRGEAVISEVTWGELCYGAYKSQYTDQVLKALKELVTIIPVLSMPQNVGQVYGEIRATLAKNGEMIGSNDLWIAAHAKASHLTLVSNNLREFERVEGLQLENWV